MHFASLRVATLCLALLVFPPVLHSQSDPAYRNPSLPVAERVADLLARMTPEEKFWQLFMIPGDLDAPGHDYSHGIYGLQIVPVGHDTGVVAARRHADRINRIQRFFVEQTRLGIPIIPFEEALHGLVREGATVFPQAIGLAASWDTTLMAQVASAIADETRRRGIRQVLSPVINIATDVRWGRTEETYGEDPLLTSLMGAAYVRALESAGVVTTPKHFIANVGEGGRDSYPIELSRRRLMEVHFPPFRAALAAGARSVMSAYNSVDGLPATQNPWLLDSTLRRAWSFHGVVISDAAATGGATVLHLTEPNTPVAAQHAFEAGLDVVFQSSWEQHAPYWRAVREGLVADSVLDRAVARVLRLKFELGLFERPYVDPASAAGASGSPAGIALAREAARASLVLLRNTNQALPLNRRHRKIAVIGEDAAEARLGGYSGTSTRVVSVLAALRQRARPGMDVRYAPGPGRLTPTEGVVPRSALSGLTGAYFDNPDLVGPPRVSRPDSTVDFAWVFESPVPALTLDWFSVRWTGTLTVPSTGATRIGVDGNDGFRLYLDERLLLDRWAKGSGGLRLAAVRLPPGSIHRLRLEFNERRGHGRVRLVWDAEVDRHWARSVDSAVALARRSDVAIVMAGIEEGEFRDRSSLRLPGHQEALIRAVARTGTPTVVVLTGGSAVTMQSWIDSVAAVIDAWYPGEQGGPAIADVLFGDYNPAGRLPITFPKAEGQLPLSYNHKPTGRGDDYLDLTGAPQFPFGFGLSYTTFRYDSLTITPARIAPDGHATVRFRLINTGRRAGDEVVQLYLHDQLASLAQPVIALKGFQRIHLAPGEARTVTFMLGREELQMLDGSLTWRVEPGDFRVMIGASSGDIRLAGTLGVP